MKRSVPIVPTLVVLIACAIMVRFGFWQLDRLDQKEAMLARFEAAQSMSAEVRWPLQPKLAADKLLQPDLYRRSRIDCAAVTGTRVVSGHNALGEAGFAHIADCLLTDRSVAPVVLGWSRGPDGPAWRGGLVSGWIAPGPRLVADPPLAGLQPNARPDPRDLPNNHLAYAVQWFAFAGVALVIYAIAVRKRMGG